eukprot:gene8175-5704_t
MQRSLIPGHNNNRHLTNDEIENNIGGLPVTDNRIQELFDSLDSEHTGAVSLDAVKQFYLGLEHYGLEPSDREVDELVRKYATSTPDSLTYDEFACFVLGLAQWRSIRNIINKGPSVGVGKLRAVVVEEEERGRHTRKRGSKYSGLLGLPKRSRRTTLVLFSFFSIFCVHQCEVLSGRSRLCLLTRLVGASSLQEEHEKSSLSFSLRISVPLFSIILLTSFLSPPFSFTFSFVGTMQRSLIPGHNNNRHLTNDEIENNIGGLPVTDNRIQELFDSLDSEHTGAVSLDAVKQFYLGLEHYGLEPSDREVDELVRKYATSTPDSLTYDEFACFLLVEGRWMVWSTAELAMTRIGDLGSDTKGEVDGELEVMMLCVCWSVRFGVLEYSRTFGQGNRTASRKTLLSVAPLSLSRFPPPPFDYPPHSYLPSSCTPIPVSLFRLTPYQLDAEQYLLAYSWKGCWCNAINPRVRRAADGVPKCCLGMCYGFPFSLLFVSFVSHIIIIIILLLISFHFLYIYFFKGARLKEEKQQREESSNLLLYRSTLPTGLFSLDSVADPLYRVETGSPPTTHVIVLFELWCVATAIRCVLLPTVPHLHSTYIAAVVSLCRMAIIIARRHTSAAERVPVEIWCAIQSFLSTQDVVECGRVCQHLRRASMDVLPGLHQGPSSSGAARHFLDSPWELTSHIELCPPGEVRCCGYVPQQRKLLAVVATDDPECYVYMKRVATAGQAKQGESAALSSYFSRAAQGPNEVHFFELDPRTALPLSTRVDLPTAFAAPGSRLEFQGGRFLVCTTAMNELFVFDAVLEALVELPMGVHRFVVSPCGQRILVEDGSHFFYVDADEHLEPLEELGPGGEDSWATPALPSPRVEVRPTATNTNTTTVTEGAEDEPLAASPEVDSPLLSANQIEEIEMEMEMGRAPALWSAALAGWIRMPAPLHYHLIDEPVSPMWETVPRRPRRERCEAAAGRTAAVGRLSTSPRRRAWSPGSADLVASDSSATPAAPGLRGPARVVLSLASSAPLLSGSLGDSSAAWHHFWVGEHSVLYEHEGGRDLFWEIAVTEGDAGEAIRPGAGRIQCPPGSQLATRLQCRENTAFTCLPLTWTPAHLRSTTSRPLPGSCSEDAATERMIVVPSPLPLPPTRQRGATGLTAAQAVLAATTRCLLGLPYPTPRGAPRGRGAATDWAPMTREEAAPRGSTGTVPAPPPAGTAARKDPHSGGLPFYLSHRTVSCVAHARGRPWTAAEGDKSALPCSCDEYTFLDAKRGVLHVIQCGARELPPSPKLRSLQVPAPALRSRRNKERTAPACTPLSVSSTVEENAAVTCYTYPDLELRCASHRLAGALPPGVTAQDIQCVAPAGLYASPGPPEGGAASDVAGSCSCSFRWGAAGVWLLQVTDRRPPQPCRGLAFLSSDLTATRLVDMGGDVAAGVTGQPVLLVDQGALLLQEACSHLMGRHETDAGPDGYRLRAWDAGTAPAAAGAVGSSCGAEHGRAITSGYGCVIHFPECRAASTTDGGEATTEGPVGPGGRWPAAVRWMWQRCCTAVSPYTVVAALSFASCYVVAASLVWTVLALLWSALEAGRSYRYAPPAGDAADLVLRSSSDCRGVGAVPTLMHPSCLAGNSRERPPGSGVEVRPAPYRAEDVVYTCTVLLSALYLTTYIR